MHQSGLGIPQNYFKAKKLYQKACDDGSAGGCSNLGHMYLEGKGVRQNSPKAVELYRRACIGEEVVGCSSHGCLSLGTMYLLGKGIQQDKAKAIKIMEDACYGKNPSSTYCDQGDPDACNLVGRVYFDAKEYSKAKKFFGHSCELENSDGCNAYRVLNQF